MNTPLTDAIERDFKGKGEWDIQSLLNNSRSLEVALDLATTQLAKTKDELARRPTAAAVEQKHKLLKKARDERASAEHKAFCLQKRIDELNESLNATVEALNCAERERDEMAKINPGGWDHFKRLIDLAERGEHNAKKVAEDRQQIINTLEARLAEITKAVPKEVIAHTEMGGCIVKKLAGEWELLKFMNGQLCAVLKEAGAPENPANGLALQAWAEGVTAMKKQTFITCSPLMVRVLNEIITERKRQDKKWGADRTLSRLLWNTILMEEVGEVAEASFSEDMKNGTLHLQEELIQVAAVAVAYAENLIRNRGETGKEAQ